MENPTTTPEEESVEALASTSNTASNVSPELKTKFLEEYTNHLDENKFNALYSKLIWSSSALLDPETKTSLAAYKWIPTISKIYWNINIEELEYYSLLWVVLKSWWMEIQTWRSSLLSLITNLYNIKDVSGLQSKINKLWKTELFSFIYSETERNKFLKEINNNKLPDTKKAVDVFKAIQWINFESLTPEQKSAIEWFNSGWYPTKELVNIINEKFTLAEKRALIKAFIPTINLYEAEERKLIEEAKADEILNSKIKTVLIWKGKTETEINEYIDTLNWLVDKKDVYLSTDDFLNNNLTTANTLEDATQTIIKKDELKWVFKESRKQVTQQEAQNNLMTKVQFYNELNSKNLTSNILWIWALKIWDVIEWNILEPSWYDNDDEIENWKIYIRIEDITENWITVKDITHPSWAWVYTDSKAVKMKNENFPDFLFILGNLKKWSRVLDSRVFEEKKKADEIKSLPNMHDINNAKDLEKMINLFDPSWAGFWLKAGTVFDFTPKNNDWKTGLASVAKVVYIDDKNITVRSVWETTFSLNEFYSSFEYQSWKRSAIINNHDDILKEFQKSDKLKWWRNVEWNKDNNWIVYLPQKDNKDFPEIKGFINKKSQYLYIKNVDPNWFDTIIWDADDKENPPKFKDGQKCRMTPELFYKYISENWLNPVINEKLITANIAINKNNIEQKVSWSQAIFKMQSFASLMSWGKQYIDSIKQTLKSTNDLQAAEFALILGKTLPASMKSELQARVDWANKKKMWDKISELENLGPAKVTEYIFSRLQISNLPRYELEALLIFVMKKHWWLYPTKLGEYAWSYFWFKKLAWLPQNADINKFVIVNPTDSKKNKTVQQIIDDKARDNQPIIEEDLIENLIISLVGSWQMRSSFTWEFLNAYKEWRRWQKEWWNDECKNKYATTGWKIKFAIWRLEGCRYMQALWAIDPILDKWWNAQQMNHVPFIFLASWIMRTLDPNEAGWYMNWLWIKRKEPMLMYWKDTAKMDLFDRVFLKFSKELSKEAWDKAEEIFALRKKWSQHKEIISECDNFWNNYWKDLVGKFNMSNPELLLKKQEVGWDYKLYMDNAYTYLGDAKYTEDHLHNELIEKDRYLFLLGWEKFLSTNLWSLGYSKHLNDWTKSAVFDCLVEWLDSIKDEQDNDKKFKLYKYYNIEILKWFIKNTNITMSSLKKSVWWNKLLERIWIPDDELRWKLSKDIDGLTDWTYDNYIKDSFEQFTNPMWIRSTNSNNIVQDTRTQYEKILARKNPETSNSRILAQNNVSNVKYNLEHLLEINWLTKDSIPDWKKIELQSAIDNANNASKNKNKRMEEEIVWKITEILEEIKEED